MNEKTEESFDFSSFTKKLDKMENIINNTLLSLQNYEKWELINATDVLSITSTMIEATHEIQQLRIIKAKHGQTEATATELLQKTMDKVSLVISRTGTNTIEDMLFFMLEENDLEKIVSTSGSASNSLMKSKIDLIMKYLHPISFKNVPYKTPHPSFSNTICCNKIIDEIEDNTLYNDFECTQLYNARAFRSQAFGLQFMIRNEKKHKMYLCKAIVDDIVLDCIENEYIRERKTVWSSTDHPILKNWLESMTLREILITGNGDFYHKEVIVLHDVNMVKKNKIDLLIKKTIEMDLYHVRNFIISLMLYEEADQHYVKYVSYLLYDVITIQNKTQENNNELYNSFPWKIKKLLKDCIYDSIKWTDKMNQKFDANRLTLEQQVYLLQAPDSVKEKAMYKLREINSKGGDENSKIKQYLEGLVRIPFQILREEPILKTVKTINQWFVKIKQHKMIAPLLQSVSPKEKYTPTEILAHCETIRENIFQHLSIVVKEVLPKEKATRLNKLLKTLNIKFKKETKEKTMGIVESHLTQDNIYKIYDFLFNDCSLVETMKELDANCNQILNTDVSLKTIVSNLDKSVYGHEHAKNQILKVFGQWMTGKQTGYCFGFEGSPGIGKTSLAKYGLANCLRETDGTTRPFHFIALGGSSNGSTLEGHGYTYQNSMWGKIVDILIESKCMNPIIYIDELDKVSKTEHGREIIGILTHLIDSTQNGGFQDKYFSGVELDMSNVLFVFSYNNAEDIDPILLDRIHRIKFNNLTLDEKVVIVKQFIFPELFEKMGLDKNILSIDDTIIQYIIKTYTNEPGIRKLKELFFDMVGEINIEILKRSVEIPVVITESNLSAKYLKKYGKNREKRIHEKCQVGCINGLYANSLGQGGIIPIQCVFFPSSTFLDFKVTGLIGNVMQESMNVAKSIAWNLTPDDIKIKWTDEMSKTKNQGIHIHCPEGGTKKDGPSGGCCITVAIYSLLNDKPISNNIAITGEIDLQGNITAIGGLEYKIMGGIKSGVVHFLFPEENKEDYLDILEKYKDQTLFSSIQFTMISHIRDVIQNTQIFL